MGVKFEECGLPEDGLIVETCVHAGSPVWQRSYCSFRGWIDLATGNPVREAGFREPIYWRKIGSSKWVRVPESEDE